MIWTLANPRCRTNRSPSAVPFVSMRPCTVSVMARGEALTATWALGTWATSWLPAGML